MYEVEVLFTGPWDSSWLDQIHQLQHPYAYNFLGALAHSSATPRMLNFLGSGDHSFQRGIIRPPAKLSQNTSNFGKLRWMSYVYPQLLHQNYVCYDFWSVPYLLIWTSESCTQQRMFSYGVSLITCKQKWLITRTVSWRLQENFHHSNRKWKSATLKLLRLFAAAIGQPKKRWRPKRSMTSVNALCESVPQACGRKAALSKAQLETKSPIFEKVVLNKAENKEKTYMLTILLLK